MGLTYSFMMPQTQRKQRTYEYISTPKKYNKKYNNYIKHKKSRRINIELINPIESTSTIDDNKQTNVVFD